MHLPRRAALALPALLLAGAARAQASNVPERAMGDAAAKVVVHEWFSLTCSHCADFQKTTFPEVREKLIDTGRIRYVWRDYPLDQVALAGAMVARALPPERYEPFISVLLASQDRWAFARNVNPLDELAKIAALAGLARPAFNAAVNDDALRTAILAEQNDAEKKRGVTSTPTFVINGKNLSGAARYPDFLKAVEAAGV